LKNSENMSPHSIIKLAQESSGHFNKIREEFGIEIVSSHSIRDQRGLLNSLEFNDELPFTPMRLFYIQDVPNGLTRGGHAHKHCQQILFSIADECEISLKKNSTGIRIKLDSPSLGIYVPSAIWADLKFKSQNSLLLVLASHPYDELDYLRDYQQFVAYQIENSGEV
jgi:hypothetical protein